MNIKTANRLCELRKQNNLSQEELANKLGVSRQAVSKWERSEASPDTDNLILLAKLYNISLDELINGEEEAKLAEEIKDSNTIDDNDEEDQFSELKEELKKEEVVITKKDYVVKANKDNITLAYNDGYTKVVNTLEFQKRNRKYKLISGAVTGSYAILTVIVYLILGFMVPKGFQNFWFLFILIPFVGSILEVIRKKNIEELSVACLIVTIYCANSVFTGLWHPLWIMLLVIPIWHIIFNVVAEKCHLDYYEKLEEAYNSYIRKKNINNKED